MQKLITLLLLLIFSSEGFTQTNQSEKSIANQYLRDARILRSNGALEQSTALLVKALPLLKKLQMWNKSCRTQSLLSEYYRYVENWDSVKAIQERVLLESIRHLGKNNRFELQAYIALGEVHQKRSENNLALKYLEEALNLINRKPVGKQDLRVAVNSELGVVYLAQARVEDALNAFEAAELASKKKPAAELPLLAKHKASYAKALLKIEQYDRALEFAKNSLNIYIPLYGQSHAKIAQVKVLMAQIYAAKGDDLKAEESWKTAEKYLSKSSKNLETFANIYMSQGLYFKERGRTNAARSIWTKAIQFLEQEIGRHHPLIANFYEVLTILALEENQIQQATEAIGLGLKSIMPLTENPYQLDSSQTLLLSSAQTLRFYHLKQRLYWMSYLKDAERSSLTNIIKLFIELKKMKKYLKLEGGNASERYQIYLKERQIAILAAKAAAKLKDQTVLMDALEWERWNWKSYTLSSSMPTALSQLDPELGEKEKEIAEKYQSLLRQYRKAILQKEGKNDFQKKLLDLNLSYFQLQQQQKKQYPDHYYGFHEMPAILVDQFIQDLEQRAVLLFLTSEQTVYRFYCNKNDWDFQVFSDLSPLLLQLNQSFQDKTLDNVEKLGADAHSLYQTLMADLFEEGYPSHLSIVIDEGLNSFPFELLLTAEAKGKIKKWPFLFKQIPISYNFAFSDLLGSTNTPATKEFLFLSSNYKDRTPSNYAVAKAWAMGYNQANKFRKKLNANFLSNYEATETNFRNQNFDKLQAIHMGHWVNASQNVPSIYLHYEYDSLYEGRLRADELPEWRLGLITMAHLGDSTADWRHQAALLLALQKSGAESILWPRWELPPAISQAILLRFYQYLADGFPKTEAWQKAQIDHLAKLKGKKQLPYYWAAFQLSGKDGELILVRKTRFPWEWVVGVGGALLFILGLFFMRRSN